MGKLRPLPQRRVIKILEANGFVKVRSKRHITFKKKDSSGRILVTYVPHKHYREVTVFVLRYIIKQTGKAREEFEI